MPMRTDYLDYLRTQAPVSLYPETEAEVKAAGLAVVANDTGRVLMLQRALHPDDPASGKWEFPGGNLEPNEDPQDAAVREWTEETGHKLPDGTHTATWTSPNGIYQGFVYRIPEEAQLQLNLDLEDRPILNPDDPDGDQIEVIAWWDPQDLPTNPALRDEVRTTDWQLLRNPDHLLAHGSHDQLTHGDRAGVGESYDEETSPGSEEWYEGLKKLRTSPVSQAASYWMTRDGKYLQVDDDRNLEHQDYMNKNTMEDFTAFAEQTNAVRLIDYKDERVVDLYVPPTKEQRTALLDFMSKTKRIETRIVQVVATNPDSRKYFNVKLRDPSDKQIETTLDQATLHMQGKTIQRPKSAEFLAAQALTAANTCHDAATGRFCETGGGYRPDFEASDEGEFIFPPYDNPKDPLGIKAPPPVWKQNHRRLVVEALHSWKGDPVNFQIHASEALNGADKPSSGSGKKMRAQAEALLWELHHKARTTTKTLYRGAETPPRADRFEGWSELKSVATSFQKKRPNGNLYTIPKGKAKGLRTQDYIHSQLTESEREWIIDYGTLTASAGETETIYTPFANDCHDEQGRFCEADTPATGAREFTRRDLFRRNVRDNLTHLSEDEQKAVLSYQGDFVDLNNFHRHPERVALKHYAEQIKHIDTAMLKSTTGEDMTVYRGIGGSTGDRVNELEPGETFSDKGYTSTAGTSAVADLFGSTKTYRILVPKGTHAIPLGGGERELVLDRNTKFEKVDERTLRVVSQHGNKI